MELEFLSEIPIPLSIIPDAIMDSTEVKPVLSVLVDEKQGPYGNGVQTILKYKFNNS